MNNLTAQQYVIFDLDGCIADDRRRLPLINHQAKDPWAAYHADCANDPLINEHYVELANHYKVIVFTARPETVRNQTRYWLKRVANITPAWLFMRAAGGCRISSPELKRQHLEFLLTKIELPREQIVMALDDREDVLAVYKQYNIRTLKTDYPLLSGAKLK